MERKGHSTTTDKALCRNKCKSSTSEQTEWDKERIGFFPIYLRIFKSSGASLRSPSNILCALEAALLTWELEVSPFLGGATEAVPVLLEVAAAGHEQLITALLCVTLRVKLDGEVDSTRNVNFILRNKHSSFVSCHTALPTAH